MSSVAEYSQELEQEAAITRRSLERVPADRLSWAPHPKSMTLGTLALHLAVLPGAISQMAVQPAFDLAWLVPHPQATSTQEVLAAHDRSVSQARATLASLSDDDLQLPWQLLRDGELLFAIPRANVFRATLFNHCVHHRGQLTVYLRELGIAVPAIYGASADEQMSFT